MEKIFEASLVFAIIFVIAYNILPVYLVRFTPEYSKKKERVHIIWKEIIDKVAEYYDECLKLRGARNDDRRQISQFREKCGKLSQKELSLSPKEIDVLYEETVFIHTKWINAAQQQLAEFPADRHIALLTLENMILVIQRDVLQIRALL